MAIILQNFAAALLTSAIGTADTSITVGSTANLPTLTAATNDYFYAVITSATDLTQREIVRVTAISGTTLTVTRAQEGTTALAFPVGSLLEQRMTAKSLADYRSEYAGSWRYSGALSTDVTLGPANAGQIITVGNGANITLPARSLIKAGNIFAFKCTGTSASVIAPSGDSFVLNNGTSAATLTLLPGDDLFCVNLGDAGWIAYGTTIMSFVFRNVSQKASNGYQMLPGGTLLQWGTFATSSTQPGIFNYPIAFSNACLQIVCSDSGNTVYAGAASPYTLSSFKAYSRDYNGTYWAGTMRYMAIGY